MKHFRLLELLLLLMVPLAIQAQSSTSTKIVKSTFTGTADLNYHETYASGTLTTSEANDWSFEWTGRSERNAPFFRKSELNGEECLAVTEKDAGFSLYSQFSITKPIHKISVKAGGNLGSLSVNLGDRSVTLRMSSKTDALIEYSNDLLAIDPAGVIPTTTDNKIHITIDFKDVGTDEPIYLHSITFVTEAEGMVGFTSTFNAWQSDGTLGDQQTGILGSIENTPWVGFVDGLTTPVYATEMSDSSDPSHKEPCIVFGRESSPNDLGFHLNNAFPVTGHIQKVIVSLTGGAREVQCVIRERNSDVGLQNTGTATGTPNGMFSDFTMYFNGTTEYTDALIEIYVLGLEPMFLHSVTIVQDDNEEAPHGKCGANLDYTLTRLDYLTNEQDEETREWVWVPAYKLTITGTGDMYDYDYEEAPWYKQFRYKITEIELPEGMTRVGNNAFYSLVHAQTHLPSTLKSIGSSAFWNMLYWPEEELQLPVGLTVVQNYAFQYCGDIKSIHVPATLTTIGTGALSGVFGLEKYYVDAANPVYKADGNAIIETATNTLIAGNKNTMMPNYVTEIAAYAFHGIDTDTMVISNQVKKIGDNAFYNAYITNIDIPASVTQIGRYAFGNCYKLVDVTIGSGVTYIATEAFYRCTNTLDVSCYANPDKLSWPSSTYDSYNFMPDKMTKMHVRAADLEKWQTKFAHLNVTFVGDLGGKIDPITEETVVKAETLKTADLTDNYVDNVYYNLSETKGNGYDPTHGCLVIGQTTDMTQITDATPGSTDIRDKFNGIILLVNGKGTITIDAEPYGKTQLAVRIGNGTPTFAGHNERGDFYATYNVTEPTYVYIYAVAVNTSAPALNGRAPEVGDDGLFIYAIKVIPEDSAGVTATLADDNSANAVWYDLNGRRLQGLPQQKGVYIRNGKTVVIK